MLELRALADEARVAGEHDDGHDHHADDAEATDDREDAPGVPAAQQRMNSMIAVERSMFAQAARENAKIMPVTRIPTSASPGIARMRSTLGLMISSSRITAIGMRNGL